MSGQMKLTGSINATSLPASASGATRSDRPVGPTTARSGQGHAPASLSARQASERGLLMSGTSGRPGITSSASAALTQSIASKLQVRMAWLGSTLYLMTWRRRTTPQGRSIYALRASAPRTSDSGYGSWPTPKTQDGGASQVVATCRRRRQQGRSSLAETAIANFKDFPHPVRLTASGAIQTGSRAMTASSGPLNPALSRWLMALPAEWDAAVAMAMRSARKRRSILSRHPCKGDTNEQ